MKKYVLTIAVLLFVLMSGSLYSLSNFNYTGIAFNGTGEILPSQSVNVNIKIIVSGTVSYEENHTGVTTDQFGAYTVEVGSGTLVSGVLSSITATKELRIQATISGGGTWVEKTLKPNVAVTGANTSPTSWDLTGNSGTTAGTNFIGTTDNVPFEMRVANGGTIVNQFFIGANNEIYRENPNLGGVAGNARGQAAVDLQGYRTAATQVASGGYSTVGGGVGNTASADYSTVGGGYVNTASGWGSTVGGGYLDIASGVESTVGGGQSNTASGVASTVGGGYLNIASQSYSTVGGGNLDTASGQYSTVDGGYNNTASGFYSTVGGGHSNTASGLYSTVGGGYSDTASGVASTVGGGYENTASGVESTVGGGLHNAASGGESTVGGGQSNTASGNYSTVGGGYYNVASDQYSTVGGGYRDTASGNYSTVGGGQSNEASADYSTVGGGYYAKADKYGQQAYASGRFAAQGDAQTSIFVVRNVTTNNTPTYLYLDGTTATQSITLNDQDSWTFRALVVGRSDNGSIHGSFEIRGYITNNGGIMTIDGVTVNNISSTAGINATAVVNGTALAIQVTGDATNTMRWVARVEVAQLNY